MTNSNNDLNPINKRKDNLIKQWMKEYVEDLKNIEIHF